MIEVLEFVFRDLETWLGTFLIAFALGRIGTTRVRGYKNNDKT